MFRKQLSNSETVNHRISFQRRFHSRTADRPFISIYSWNWNKFEQPRLKFRLIPRIEAFASRRRYGFIFISKAFSLSPRLSEAQSASARLINYSKRFLRISGESCGRDHYLSAIWGIAEDLLEIWGTKSCLDQLEWHEEWENLRSHGCKWKSLISMS